MKGMRRILYKLENEINSIDNGRMSVRVEGTVIHEEINNFLKKRHSKV